MTMFRTNWRPRSSVTGTPAGAGRASMFKAPRGRAWDRRRRNDEATTAWRTRMATAAAQTIYKERAATSECVNALARNRGLQQFAVRGLRKVQAVLLWFASAHNLLRAVALRQAAVTVGCGGHRGPPRGRWGRTARASPPG